MKAEERFTHNNFTVLRLLLALLVVLGHFHLLAGMKSPPWPYCYAATAVDCFFVVSGYLVTSSFDRDPDLFRFYVRRFFRIYPLYITVVAVQTGILAFLAPGSLTDNAAALTRYFVVNAAFANFLQHDVSGVLSSLEFADLNVSLWTLKIEFGFYLMLPFLWWAIRRWGNWLMLAVFVLSALYYEGLKAADSYQYAKQLPGQLQYFVLGIAAHVYRHRLPKFDPRLGVALLAGLAVAVTALVQARTPVVYPVLIGALVVVAAFRTPHVPMDADISYGVYLLHAPLIQLSLLLGLYFPAWYGLLAIVGAVIFLAVIAEQTV